MKKKIQHILKGREKQITKDETVLQPLPHIDFRFANPIIVLHHLKPKQIAAGGKLRIHPHPHRGFAPVTFQLQGEGYHKDSAGHNGIIKAGDVQWMFAGKGVLHSEGPTEELLKNGGTQELIQLWINAPKAHKWDEPFYQSATKDQQPHVLQQEGVNLRLASGEFDGKVGPLKSFTPLVSISGEVAKGKQVQFTATAGYWTVLYIAKGSIAVNQENIAEHNLIVFEKDNEEIVITANEDTQLLYLSAEPIDEPVAAKDNFVMNTIEEANQAIEDYKNGLFGTLEF
ncbi:pirin family protein [Mucilaginibacter conchicola]|uniref:Pirin family protein n=1 Tax=Mucilaginibacter conchicola TaxID=2303333 RepID=A0A372NXG2_9SPHI|nr:pirin family protein [Mucilaginibacter conchicola]RFZ94594.1 pirin family protein [Mucilaginibacter conchicola]